MTSPRSLTGDAMTDKWWQTRAPGERRRCTGCGSTESIDELRARRPGAIACCPERDMRPAVGELKRKQLSDARRREWAAMTPEQRQARKDAISRGIREAVLARRRQHLANEEKRDE